MRLTTKGRFAVTAMMDLAMRDKHTDQPIPLVSICERHGISLSYMEQLFSRLRRGELVNSLRGPGGGYHLARPAEQISVADIIQSVDERLDATLCGGQEDCQDRQRCMTHELWSELNRKMLNYLASVSLDDLVQQYTYRQGGVVYIEEKPRRAKARQQIGDVKARQITGVKMGKMAAVHH
ncbi:MAG: Rrf2 family transcriptional regulator [Zoogloeaceae bacterium]|jgi:Rrf2 family iron-sulfur cluster assembly transcriptional regulator|nr:Rrf2 family transcriptional regulator [Zoogloeaceae bacterium]